MLTEPSPHAHEQLNAAINLAKDGVTADQLLAELPGSSDELLQDLLHQGVLARDADGILRPRYSDIRWHADGSATAFDIQLGQRFRFVPVNDRDEVESLRRAIIDGVRCDVVEDDRPAPRRRTLAIAAVGVACILAVAVAIGWFRPQPPLYVAVMRPQVAESMAQGSAEVVRASTINALLNLKNVYALSGSDVDRVGSDPKVVARAVGADEVLTAEITAADDGGFRIELVRAGGKERKVASFSLAVFGARQVALASLADLTSSHVGDLFSDRRFKERSLKLKASGDDYARYATIMQKMYEPGVAYELVLDELTELRKSSPGLIAVYGLEASTSRYLYQVTTDERYRNRAEEALARGLEVAPDDPRILYSGAELALAFNDLEMTEDLIRRVELAAPLHPRLWLLKSRAAEARGEYRSALEIIAEAISRQPTWRQYRTMADIEIGCGVTLENESPIDAARRHLGKAIELAPDNHSVLGKLGELELNRGSPLAARDAFQRAASIQPQHSYLANLGLIEILIGDYDKAVSYLRRALVRGSRVPTVLLSLADALVLVGEMDEARDLYQEIADSIDDSVKPVRMTYKAIALARIGDRDGALALIQEALDASDSEEVVYQASTVYALLDNNQEASRLAAASLRQGRNPVWFTSLPWFDQVELGDLGSAGDEG
jgi:tetratricopeptide (TPR) repeat protein